MAIRHGQPPMEEVPAARASGLDAPSSLLQEEVPAAHSAGVDAPSSEVPAARTAGVVDAPSSLLDAAAQRLVI